MQSKQSCGNFPPEVQKFGDITVGTSKTANCCSKGDTANCSHELHKIKEFVGDTIANFFLKTFLEDRMKH